MVLFNGNVISQGFPNVIKMTFTAINCGITVYVLSWIMDSVLQGFIVYYKNLKPSFIRLLTCPFCLATS